MAIQDLSRINPLKELQQTFRHHGKVTAVVTVVDLMISSFITGFVYQYALHLMGKKRNVIIISCFKLGLTKCIIATAVVFAIIFFFYFKLLRMINNGRKNYEDGVERSDKATFGNAHFQDEDERKKNLILSNKISDTTNELLGIDSNGKYCSLIYPPGKNHNRIFFGSPGSGKSSAIILSDVFQCIRRKQSIIVTDSKGDIYRDTVAVAKLNGMVVKVLNIKPNELANSNGFNVMADLDSTSRTFAADCSSIANNIIQNTQGDDPMDYWAKNEAMALAMVIMELASGESYKKQKKNNLYGVFEFLSTNSAESMKDIFTRHPQGTPIRMAYNNFAKASIQNQGQVLNGLTSRLWMLNDPDVLGKVLANNEIDLTLPMKKPCVYYVIIPDSDNIFKFISSLFFTTMFKKQGEYSDSLTRKERDKQLEVYYELDEYKNIGGIMGLDTKASTIRSRKMMLTIILQLKSQLDQIHGEEAAKEILNDCTVKGLLSTSDIDTAKYFSELLGTFTVKTDGERYTESRANIFHWHGSVNKNIGEQKRPLRLPESLMDDEMPRDEVIYVIDNMAPLKLNKAFAELGGKAVHYMYAQALELAEKNGEKKSQNYRPKWRKDEEEAEQKKVELKTGKAGTAPVSKPKPAVKPSSESEETPEEVKENVDAPFSSEEASAEVSQETKKEETPEERRKRLLDVFGD